MPSLRETLYQLGARRSGGQDVGNRYFLSLFDARILTNGMSSRATGSFGREALEMVSSALNQRDLYTFALTFALLERLRSMSELNNYSPKIPDIPLKSTM